MKRENRKHMIGSDIYPNALQNGKCRFYVEKRVIRAAWGFRKLFLNVKHVDDTPRHPAIFRQSGHLLSLHERTTHPYARATRGHSKHLSCVWNRTSTTTSTVMRMNRIVSQKSFKRWNTLFHPMKLTISSDGTHRFNA